MTFPAVPESFYWADSPHGAVLKCRPLERVARHMFTTRQVALSSAGDWRRAGELVGADEVVTLNQVHGREVLLIRRGAPRAAGRPAADVLVSNDPGVAVGVRAADCVPLLLADPHTGAVAAVHAGWRGTAAGAATAAVDGLARAFQAAPERLVAAIGPSIGGCCYEVGSDVVDAFAAARHPRHLIDRWFTVGDRGLGIGDGRQGKLYLDLAGANRDQLVLAGVPETQIHMAGLCTAMHLEVLASYRMEKEKAGRIAGVIRAPG